MSTSLVAFQAAALRGRQFSGIGSGGTYAAAIARGRFNNRTGAFSGFGSGDESAGLDMSPDDESPVNASSGDSSDQGDASAAWYSQFDWGGLAAGLGQGAGAILKATGNQGMAPGTPGTITLPGGAVVRAPARKSASVFTPKNLAIGGAVLAGLFIAHKKGMF